MLDHHSLNGGTVRSIGAVLTFSISGMIVGQSECAPLSIDAIHYAAFQADAFEVDVVNSSPFSFVSPAFELLDQQGATLAQEAGYWFGISQGSQRHRLDMLDGIPLPNSPFTGTLLLHYVTLDGNESCAFPLKEVPLCPPPPCMGLQPYVWDHGNGGPMSFEWSITDGENMEVGSGTLAYDALGFAFAIDSLCLPPGGYVLTLLRDVPQDAQVEFGLRRDYLVENGLEATLDPGSVNHLPFSFFAPCAESTNGVAERDDQGIQLMVRDGVLYLTRPDGAPLGRLEVLDLSGRTVARVNVMGSSATVDLGNAATGLYFAWPRESGVPQRFYLTK